jgi:hypothetical protein
MACEVINVEGVGPAIFCARGVRAPRCRFCKSDGTVAEPIKECDYPKRAGTCDSRCCAACSLHVGEDLDYCRIHAPFVTVVGDRKIVVVSARVTRDGELVDRTSPLGNPYKLAADTPERRAECLALYRRWLWEALQRGGDVRREIERLAAAVKERDLALVCWCAPKACHGQVVASALRWYLTGERRNS